MAAFELFAATTTNTFIEHIKTKAEAYGWTIDFFGLYSGNNRLHLHNTAGAHFEIWYSSGLAVNIRGCTGYSSTDTPLAQPGTSGTVPYQCSSYWHFIVVSPDSIFIKSTTSANTANIQFGTIVDKIGSWIGGNCISCGNFLLDLWVGYSSGYSQVLIDGTWSTLISVNGGGVSGYCESELSAKMPFAYSGGILPAPLLLIQRNPTTAANMHPIGYAPDVKYFRGGDVYEPLSPITIDGYSWLPINRLELNSVTSTSIADTLIRLAV